MNSDKHRCWAGYTDDRDCPYTEESGWCNHPDCPEQGYCYFAFIWAAEALKDEGEIYIDEGEL